MKHISFNIHIVSLVVLTLLSSNIYAHTTGGIVVEDAWIREGPPNTKVFAAYLEIQNHTADKRSLKGASSPRFKRVEFHLSTNVGGVASMKPLSNIDIPAQGKVNFTPGGLHIMLIDAQQPLKSGESVSLTFKFSDDSTYTTQIPVKKMKSAESHDNHDQHHAH